MTNFVEEETAISGLVDSFSSLGTQLDSPDQIKHYEGLVTEELERLHDAYLVLWNGISNRPDPLVIFNQVEIRAELFDQLQSKRLPTLQRQLNSLSEALVSSRSDLQDKPVTKLKLVLKILSKLDVTLGKIKFAIACINPDLEADEVRYDKDFKKLKSFLCRRLALKVYQVTGLVCKLLQTSARYYQRSGHQFNEHQPRRKTKILTMKSNCSKSIDKLIEYMNKTELNHIQYAWRMSLNSVIISLGKFLKFVAQSSTKIEDSHSIPDLEPSRPSTKTPPPADPSGLSRATIAVITIMKLMRMFFKKMLKISNDKQSFKMVTYLSSRELDTCLTGPHNLAEAIECLVETLSEDPEEDNHYEDVMIINQAIHRLITTPQLVLFMIDYVFEYSFLPDHLNSRKVNYKAWFYQWNQEHHLATRNFLEALRFLIPPDP
ncbi:hypothetical protein PSTG_17317 [Puccinia striiformis f. sp. tritici PST-78]|uniref:Uncharacterized protein n=1 Tax=Puccinia striiformis f. sp. tritici PST-78 TaxID=1165861 RepID=A0A0L0UQ63_9BASI|nr:hypothetical protein PSTG_17317 [Puccinia striiformis f. sp. tritici PST-78]